MKNKFKFKFNTLNSIIIILLFFGAISLLANREIKENVSQIQKKEQAPIKSYMISPAEVNENNYYSEILPGISFDYQTGYEVNKVAPREDCWHEDGVFKCSPKSKPFFAYLLLKNLNTGFGSPSMQYWEKEKGAEKYWIYLGDEQYGENKFKVYKPDDAGAEAPIYVLDISKNYNLIIQYTIIDQLPIPIDLVSLKFIYK